MEINELKTALGEELFTQVSAKVAGIENLRIINTGDGKWIPKTRFDAERQQSKDLQAQMEDLKNQLEENTRSAEQAAEGYQAQIERLKKSMGEREAKMNELTGGLNEKESRITALTEDLKNRDGTIEGLQAEIGKRDSQIADLHREGAIRRELEKHHPRDADIVYRLLDQTKISRNEDGSWSGIQEQLEGLKKDQSYLFGRTYSHKGGFPEGSAAENPPRAGENTDVNAVIRSACGR